MKVISAGITDKGHVRQNNEDNMAVNEKMKFFIVADGAGGMATGEVASKLAVDISCQQMEKYFNGEHIMFGKKFYNLSEKANALVSAVRFANQIILEASKKYPQNQGMATTCVAVIVEEDKFSCCNVGDSRIYLFRDGALKLLTNDHTLVMEQVRRGLITEEQAEKSEYKNVLVRALGTDPSVEIDASETAARDGDILLLCSDGLTRMVNDGTITDSIKKNLAAGASIEDISRVLLTLALDAGGHDNVTIVMLQLFKENKGLLGLFSKAYKTITK